MEPDIQAKRNNSARNRKKISANGLLKIGRFDFSFSYIIIVIKTMKGVTIMANIPVCLLVKRQPICSNPDLTVLVMRQ